MRSDVGGARARYRANSAIHSGNPKSQALLDERNHASGVIPVIISNGALLISTESISSEFKNCYKELFSGACDPSDSDILGRFVSLVEQLTHDITSTSDRVTLEYICARCRSASGL